MDSKIWLFPKNFQKFSPKNISNNIPIQAHNLHPVYHIWVSKLVKWPKYSPCTFSWCLHFPEFLKILLKFNIFWWKFLLSKKYDTNEKPTHFPTPKIEKKWKKNFSQKKFCFKNFFRNFFENPFFSHISFKFFPTFSFGRKMHHACPRGAVKSLNPNK